MTKEEHLVRVRQLQQKYYGLPDQVSISERSFVWGELQEAKYQAEMSGCLVEDVDRGEETLRALH